jgi:glycosyltransferase involved in cell wall biosynthesis
VKVALLTGDYPPYSGGGVGSLSYELARGLLRAGVDVVVITRSARTTHVIRREKYNVYYLASPPIPPKDVWYYTLRMIDVRKILNDERPDVIHDLSAFTAFQPWITKLAPTVYSVQGSPQLSIIRRTLGLNDALRDILFEISHRLQPTFMGLIKRPEIRVWVYVSKFVMLDSLMRIQDEGLRRELMGRSMVVYNGVDVKSLRAIRDEVVKSEGIEEGSVVFIGRLMEYKGVKFLVKAFRHVVDELRDAVLHIVGDGPIFNEVRGLVEKFGLKGRVIMHGALPRDRAMRILARSTLLTHPSLYESFGMVIAEAYAMGKPVVTHRAGYAKELVEEPRAGLSINVINAKEYAGALITLLTDKGLYKRLSQNASAFAEERLSVDAMVRGYIDAYRRAVNHV